MHVCQFSISTHLRYSNERKEVENRAERRQIVVRLIFSIDETSCKQLQFCHMRREREVQERRDLSGEKQNE